MQFRKRNQRDRKGKPTSLHQQRLLAEEAARLQIESEIQTSPEFARYRQLVGCYGVEIIDLAVGLAADVAFVDADSPDAHQLQAQFPNAPNDDRCGPEGRRLVNELAELVATAREARKTGGTR